MNAIAVSSSPAVSPVITLIEGVATTTSLEVARVFGKIHRDVVRAIENLIQELDKERGMRIFAHTQLINEQNSKTYSAYRLTRDGFTLLAMGFTGKRALQFKLAYIDAFNKMEAALKLGNPALPHLVNEAQAGEIATLIAERFPQGRDRPYAWGRFNRHFRLARYRELPAARFDEACEYIRTMPALEPAGYRIPDLHPDAELKKYNWFITYNHIDGKETVKRLPRDHYPFRFEDIPAFITDPEMPIQAELLVAISRACLDRLHQKILGLNETTRILREQNARSRTASASAATPARGNAT